MSAAQGIAPLDLRAVSMCDALCSRLTAVFSQVTAKVLPCIARVDIREVPLDQDLHQFSYTIKVNMYTACKPDSVRVVMSHKIKGMH